MLANLVDRKRVDADNAVRLNAMLETPEHLRAMLCLTPDGTLYISSSHRANPHVLSFIDRLTRKGATFTPKYVPVSLIQAVYQRLRDDVDVSQRMQRKQRKSVDLKIEATASQQEVINLIREAVSHGVSDIHIRIMRHLAEVWMRCDGIMEKRHEMQAQQGKSLCSTIYQSMCDVADPIYLPEKAQSARLKQEILAPLGLNGARLASRPTDAGCIMVLRLLYRKENKPTVSQLGFLPEQEEMFRRMQQRTRGVNIISGATGSGKSTTLEVILSEIMRRRESKINLMTVEDPPEYMISGAVQTPVIYDARASDEEISQAWARSISDLMRLDPDIAMVGEIRDLSSAKSAFRLAMTGHGVWTTLHANDAIAALARLHDIGVDLTLVTDPGLITGLASQSLVPVLCEHCKVPIALARAELEVDLLARIDHRCDVANVHVAGPGCPQCNGRGIRGRTVIAEMVLPTDALMQSYRKEGTYGARRYWIEQMSGITKIGHLIRMIEAGRVDPALGEKFVGLLDDNR